MDREQAVARLETLVDRVERETMPVPSARCGPSATSHWDSIRSSGSTCTSPRT